MENLFFLIGVCASASMAGVVVYAMYNDLRVYQIPNWISIFVALAFLPCAATANITLVDFSIHIAVGFLVLVLGMIAFAFRLLGGGDVKLFAALAIWFGWDLVGQFALITAAIGGILGLMIIILRAPFATMIVGAMPWVKSRIFREAPMPYGIAIGVAALVLFPEIAVLPVEMAQWIGQFFPW